MTVMIHATGATGSGRGTMMTIARKALINAGFDVSDGPAEYSLSVERRGQPVAPQAANGCKCPACAEATKINTEGETDELSPRIPLLHE